MVSVPGVDFFEVRQLSLSPGTASFETSFSSRRQLIDNVLVVRDPYDRYELRRRCGPMKVLTLPPILNGMARIKRLPDGFIIPAQPVLASTQRANLVANIANLLHLKPRWRRSGPSAGGR
jgi:hypothetical protein